MGGFGVVWLVFWWSSRHVSVIFSGPGCRIWREEEWLSIENLSFAMNKLFPLVVICSMNYIGPSGEPVQVSGICTLPINILNEIPTDVQLVIKFRISKVTKECFELTGI